MGIRVSGLVAIKAALTQQIRDFYADAEIAFQVENQLVLNPSPPTIDVYQASFAARDLQTAGFADWAGAYFLTVRFRMETADYDAGSEILDELSDDESDLSLLAAIYDDPTLNGNVTSLDVQQFSGLTVYPDGTGAGAWLGFDYRVLCLAAQS